MGLQWLRERDAAGTRPLTRAPIHRRALLGALLLILATALPVLLLRTPPMVDVLGHAGRYALQTGLADQPFWQTYYSFRWQIIGNLGADLLVQVLQPLLGVMGAVRLVVVLVPVMAASAVVLLSREFHGRVTAPAILALTLVYGLPFSWGFLNFSLSMACALLAFWLWLRLGTWRSRRLRAWLFVPVSLMVWTCHTFGWAFLGILCTAESLVRASRAAKRRDRALRSAVRDVLPLLAPLVPMLLWRDGAGATDTNGWFDFAQKAGWLAQILRLDWRVLDLASAGLLGVVLLGALASRKTRLAPVPTLAAGIAGLAFVIMPRQIFGSVFADMRLVPYAAIMALLAIRPAPHLSRIALALSLAFLVMRLALTGYTYREREAAVERQLEALTVIPERARVAMLIALPCPPEWSLPWYSHLGSMALIHKPIFVNDQWANASMNPLSVHYPAAGAFATDDRQLFLPRRCGSGEHRLADTLRAMPMAAFTHVWVVGDDRDMLQGRRDLKLVWQRGEAAVFAVRSPATMANTSWRQRISKLSKLQP